MNNIVCFNKPYLILNTTKIKKELGLLSGLIDLLNNCNSKKEFKQKIKFHLKSLFMTIENKNKIIKFINLNIKVRSIIKKYLKIKKEKQTYFTNDTDIMSFDNINEIDKNDIFIIYDKEEEKKYWFQTDTLVKLINQSLTNSDNIVEINSKKPYNPYNRKDFDKFQLNSIYNYLLEKNKLPILLHLYKMSNYNINNFIYVNRLFLDDYIIKNIDDEDPIELLRYFQQICNDKNINFTRYDIILDNIENYIGQIKDIIRFSYHSNFRDLPIKKMIEYFINYNVYNENNYSEDDDIEMVDSPLSLNNIQSVYFNLSEVLEQEV